MSKKKFNQDEFGWTLSALRNDLNKLKSKELKQEQDIAEKQLEVRDRVDLSLKEYREMQQEIKSLKDKTGVLKSKNDFLEGLVKDFHIGDMLQIIDYKTIKTQVVRDELTRKTKVKITFNIEPLELGE